MAIATPTYRPCSDEPDLWFGYADDDAGDGAAKARAYEKSAAKAQTICLRHCPLAQQRDCAQQAIAGREEYGVWAGVKLPGGQYRKRHQLARAHEVLRQIARGAINPRELTDSVELLSRHDPLPAPASAVVHLPLGQQPSKPLGQQPGTAA